MPNKPFVPLASLELQHGCYAMAIKDGTRAEITMYGEVVEQRPCQWWTGEPIEGDFIVRSEFLDDLEQVKDCRELFIRLDTIGGAVPVALLIYNRLREFSAAGTKITVQVDGVSMSAGAVIMCAADEVVVHPSNIIMVHSAACVLCGYYNNAELRKISSQLAAADKSQVSIISKKTGEKCSAQQVQNMLNAETYMTGTEAYEKGLADVLDEDYTGVQIAASADRTVLYAGGRALRLPAGMALPEDAGIPTFTPAPATGADAINKPKPAAPANSEGGNPMAEPITAPAAAAPVTAPAAQAQTPAAAAAPDNQAALTDAVAQERARIQAISEIAPSIADQALVADAMFTNPCSAQELAFRALKAQASQGAAHVAAVTADAKASGAAEVPPAEPPADGADEDPKTPEAKMAAGRAAAKALNKEVK